MIVRLGEDGESRFCRSPFMLPPSLHSVLGVSKRKCSSQLWVTFGIGPPDNPFRASASATLMMEEEFAPFLFNFSGQIHFGHVISDGFRFRGVEVGQNDDGELIV